MKLTNVLYKGFHYRVVIKAEKPSQQQTAGHRMAKELVHAHHECRPHSLAWLSHVQVPSSRNFGTCLFPLLSTIYTVHCQMEASMAKKKKNPQTNKQNKKRLMTVGRAAFLKS